MRAKFITLDGCELDTDIPEVMAPRFYSRPMELDRFKIIDPDGSTPALPNFGERKYKLIHLKRTDPGPRKPKGELYAEYGEIHVPDDISRKLDTISEALADQAKYWQSQ